jgi:hypothetical protein
MARLLRLDVPDIAQHVIQQGNNPQVRILRASMISPHMRTGFTSIRFASGLQFTLGSS